MRALLIALAWRIPAFRSWAVRQLRIPVVPGPIEFSGGAWERVLKQDCGCGRKHPTGTYHAQS